MQSYDMYSTCNNNHVRTPVPGWLALAAPARPSINLRLALLLLLLTVSHSTTTTECFLELRVEVRRGTTGGAVRHLRARQQVVRDVRVARTLHLLPTDNVLVKLASAVADVVAGDEAGHRERLLHLDRPLVRRVRVEDLAEDQPALLRVAERRDRAVRWPVVADAPVEHELLRGMRQAHVRVQLAHLLPPANEILLRVREVRVVLREDHRLGRGGHIIEIVGAALDEAEALACRADRRLVVRAFGRGVAQFRRVNFRLLLPLQPPRLLLLLVRAARAAA